MANHPIVHFEFQTKDGAALAKFYADTFGWETQNIPDAGNYQMVNTGEGSLGGGINTTDQMSGTLIYVQCDDIHEGVAKAEANGATVVMPVESIPGMVTMALLSDPQGNVFGLVDAKTPE